MRLRCGVLGELTPYRSDQRSRFRQWVRECVGEPVAPRLTRDSDADAIVAIDKDALNFAALGPEGFPPEPECAHVAMIRLYMAHKKVEEILGLQLKLDQVKYLFSDGTSGLREPVRVLIEKHRRILLVTNSAGFASLTELTVKTLHTTQMDSGELRFLEVRD